MAPAPNRSPGELLWDGERWLLPEDIPAEGLLHSKANPYTEDLLKLQMHSGSFRPPPGDLRRPLAIEGGQMEGIHHGFRVGFNYAARPTRVTN